MVFRIGHRGAAGYEPENTLRSMMKGFELGCDMVELDVHLCGTGEVVVIHDEAVDRTTNGTGNVSDLPYSYLKSLDAGKGEIIPLLGDVLDTLWGKIGVNIELKGPGCTPPVYEIMMNAVDKGWSLQDFNVSSFNWDMLREMAQYSKDIKLGILSYEAPTEALEYARSINAYSLNIFHGVIDETYVQKAHEQGLKVFPWTVNDPQDITHMKSIGVDGIISDFPDRV